MPVTAWDPTPYPDPRKKRTLPVQQNGVPIEPDIRAPEVYLWSLRLRETTINEMAVAGSRRIRGPAIIKDVTGFWQFNQTSGSRLSLFGLYWDTASYTSAGNQTAGIAPHGTSIYELTRVADDAFTLAFTEGFTAFPSNTVAGVRTYPIGKLVNAPEIFLCAFIEMRGNAGEVVADCVVRVYENVDPLVAGRYL